MRLFPRTARRRLVAATAACCLALGALAVPLAMAEDGKDLKHRQKDAKQQVEHAQHDLDESSSRLRSTQAAAIKARAALEAAWLRRRALRAQEAPPGSAAPTDAPDPAADPGADPSAGPDVDGVRAAAGRVLAEALDTFGD